MCTVYQTFGPILLCMLLRIEIFLENMWTLKNIDTFTQVCGDGCVCVGGGQHPQYDPAYVPGWARSLSIVTPAPGKDVWG